MPPASDIAIDVRGLSKSFGNRKVVRDLSMQVKRGDDLRLPGPNGSGKTTTIRMLTGLLTPDQGRAPASATTSGPQADEIKRHVGYMTQRFSLYQDLSVRENLEFVARLYGHRKSGRRRRARWSSGSVLPAARSSSPANYPAAGSSASRSAPVPCQTRSFCCSMSRPPASTPKARREFWNEIHALAALGLTVLVSTHYMDEAERCHEIAYIAYGVLLRTAPYRT